MVYEFGSGDKEELRSEAREARKSVNIVSELRTRRKLSIGRCFFLFLSSPLFSIHYYFIRSRPSIKGVLTDVTTSGSQSMGSGVSPCAGCTERLQYGANR